MAFNETETVIILSKHDRIHNGIARVWTNDIVVINMLKRLKAIEVSEFNYELPLEQFAILPKRRTTKVNKPVTYPKFIILPNDNLDKETAINFSQDERKRKIMHITTDDEYFLARCKKFNLPYVDGAFVSKDDFRAFGKKAKLDDTERVARSERMREAKKLGMLRA